MVHFIVLQVALQPCSHVRFAQMSLFVMTNWRAKREKLTCDNFQPGKA